MKAFDLVNWIIAAVALLHKITKVGSGRATVKARGQVATAKYKTHNTNYKIQNTKYKIHQGNCQRQRKDRLQLQIVKISQPMHFGGLLPMGGQDEAFLESSQLFSAHAWSHG